MMDVTLSVLIILLADTLLWNKNKPSCILMVLTKY